MSAFRSMLPMVYPLMHLFRLIRRKLVGSKAFELRVLICHDIAPHEFGTFRRQLLDLSRSWKLVSPSQFERIMRGEESLTWDSLLLTFDDGFASNRKVVDQVLRPLNIKAIFFVVTDFIDQHDLHAARKFIFDRLQIGASSDALPEHRRNMSWDDLAYLVEQGHMIGGHTASHERLCSGVSTDVLMREIIDSADRLANTLGTSINHFAYPFGNLQSFSREAMLLAKSRFEFVHSGLRGVNRPGKAFFAIRRDAVSTADSPLLIRALLEGASDFLYRRRGLILERWAK